MYALSNPDVLIPDTSYQYKVVSVLADLGMLSIGEGGFPRWEASPLAAVGVSSNTVQIQYPNVPASAAKYRLISRQSGGVLKNEMLWLAPSASAKRPSEKDWEKIWRSLLKDVRTQDTPAFKHFARGGSLVPWHLRFGYLGYFVAGAAVLGVGLALFSRRRSAARK